MFCSKCGKDLTSVQGIFCPNCGTKIGGEEPQQKTAEIVQTAAANVSMPNTGTKKKKNPAKIIIPVAVVLLIGAGVFLFISVKIAQKINGTWINDDGDSIIQLKNGIYQLGDNDGFFERGTYTIRNNKVIFKLTHLHGDHFADIYNRFADVSEIESKWYSIDEIKTIVLNNYEMTQNHLKEAAQAAALLVSVEELDSYHTEKDTESKSYHDLKMRLVQFAKEHNVLYVYYWRQYDSENIQYIIDNDFDPKTIVGPGTIFPINDITRAALALEGKVGTTDLETYEPSWDGLLTGSAPVYDKIGNFYCIASVDMSDLIVFTYRKYVNEQHYTAFFSVSNNILTIDDTVFIRQ
jgi:hypothetical protein